MYLYIELWKGKEAWFRLTTEQRQAKLEQLLTLAQQQPITGVIPFSFRAAGDAFIFDGVTERPVIVDDGVARPTDYHYAAAWMVPTRELITRFEDRVEGLGWWFDYFEQRNAWGVMDREATVGDMIAPKPSNGARPPRPVPVGTAGAGEQVIVNVKKYYKDFIEGNYAGVVSVMRPGMTVFSPYGVLQKIPDNPDDKKFVIEKYQSFHAQGFRLQLTPFDISCTVLGDVVIATYRVQGSETPPRGRSRQVAFRGTQVWVNVSQGWMLTHMHVSSSDELDNWRGLDS